MRNVGIIAHIDAGKTTTTERMLYYMGRTHRMGSVDTGTAVTDWMPQERERGITIVSAAITAAWQGQQINLIDTPGHIDFTAEVQRVLRVLDGCIVVFDAVHGVEPQSETVWHQADHYRVPRICFVNKMDRVGADYARVLNMMRERLGATAVALQIPIGVEAQFEGVIDLLTMQAIHWEDELGARRVVQPIPRAYREVAQQAHTELLERIVETDDRLLEHYLNGAQLELDGIKEALRRATLENRLFPVYCGAALRNKGVQPVLDGVVDYLPSPRDVGPVRGTDPRTGADIECPPEDRASLAALVFKVVTDPYVGRLAYLRVYSGVLKVGDPVLNPGRGRHQRVGRLVRIYADRREDIAEVRSGDIAAVLGMKSVVTGDTLCALDAPVMLESIAFPEPVINLALEPKATADEARLLQALRDLAEEDPTCRVGVDENTGQTLLSGMGELHLEVLVDRLHRHYGVDVRIGKPRVNYKETITRPVQRVEGLFHQHIGGRVHFGQVVLDLTPATSGAGICFRDKTRGSSVPSCYLPSIEKGIRDAAERGFLAGNKIDDIVVTLRGGAYHELDSSEQAFYSAAADAFREGLRQGGAVLLEPVCKLEVLVPEAFTGEVIGQLAARRCDILGTGSGAAGTQTIRGLVPLSEMFGYATELRSATQGRGSFTMEFAHFAPVPQELMERILKGLW